MLSCTTVIISVTTLQPDQLIDSSIIHLINSCGDFYFGSAFASYPFVIQPLSTWSTHVYIFPVSGFWQGHLRPRVWVESNLKLRVVEDFVIKFQAGINTKDQSLNQVSGSRSGSEVQIKPRLNLEVEDQHCCLDTSWKTLWVYKGQGANQEPWVCCLLYPLKQDF